LASVNLFSTTGFVPRLGLYLALLAALSACLPFNEPVPPLATLVKTPIPVSLTPDTLIPSPQGTPDASPIDTPACPPGQLVSGVVDSNLLAKPMRYRVYLPPCYDEEQEHRYPVLYLLHGQTSTEDQWIRLGVPTAAERLIAAGEISPFIIVFPYDYSYLQPYQYRFEDVFLELLIPQVDTAYRTIPAAAQRAIGGLSRGGAWALHLGIHHPDVFGAIGAHSPAIFYSDTASLHLYLRDIPPNQLPRLYIDIGDADGELDNTLVFKRFLDANNIPYEWHQYIGFHNEAYWRAHVDEYLRWYASTFGN
jgi:enterochelin esterase-like enzyme